MTITLRREALDYYILSSLSVQDLSGAQILQNTASYININHADFYEALIELESRGMITRARAQKGTLMNYSLYRITPLGKGCKKALERELNLRLARH